MRIKQQHIGNSLSRQQQALVVAAFCLLGVGIVWTYLYNSSDPAAAMYLQGSSATFRVFGKASSSGPPPVVGSEDVSFTFYTRHEQRDFLVQFGSFCQKGFSKEKDNILVHRFDELPEAWGDELFKYCVLYTGVSNVYWDTQNLVNFIDWEDLLEPAANANLAVIMEVSGEYVLDSNEKEKVHHSLFRISQPFSQVCLGMMRWITQTVHLDPTTLSETLAMYVRNDKDKKGRPWKLYSARCLDYMPDLEPHTNHEFVLPKRAKTTLADHCPILDGGHCCQLWRPGDEEAGASMHHSALTDLVMRTPPIPVTYKDKPEEMTYENIGMAVEDYPFLATIRTVPTNAPPASSFETPNYFDILMHNNCLPHDKDCFKCLKTGGDPDGTEGGDCNICRKVCPCYCSALCQIRPPPKRLAAHWYVQRPYYRKDPSRLIPRVIHQTWYEPVTREGYPNMSRLIESFRQSGWEYEFYDDDRAADFLSAHFPPEVRDAYDAIIPGAFKADLFRYCVLLIRGGVYADMDIILESNLDKVIESNVGFLTAQDSPGQFIGHRHCLWNGLMATQPGHPFLAQTIQVVVNNVQNRFTSVDYDDMLCPDPVLSVSHTVDTLFTCGPCILGAGLNDVLRLHRQTGFDFGEIDLYQFEAKRGEALIAHDDPRLLVTGRSLLLKQDKEDMGAHRFTYEAANIVVAATDMPEYDDRPKSLEHYSKTHEKFGVYGLNKLYTDAVRTNEEVKIVVK